MFQLSIWIGYGLSLYICLGLSKIIREKRIDIIHTHGYRSNLFGLITSKVTWKPIVSTIHGWTASTQAVRTYEYIDKRAIEIS